MTNIPIRKLDDFKILMKPDGYGNFQELYDHRIFTLMYVKDVFKTSYRF